ncbi:DUF4184 family protein [Streptomyces hainanensis]|uniref:DUF4184 family protein n=1 Tax=Streptomyces hainanensis TaxID=402648 RepID=A0A4R4SME5_9ACTN|nr:DUF4184 family protein [Streptomyces hainanensis]TDC63272.1 DUF4184 family protein [Streptomyces hainanensis]
MPFTLSHPAAVLPLLRRPFVPAALVAGAVAPDVPYFLSVLGVSASGPRWYEPLLNPTETHAPGTGLLVNLPAALGLVALLRLLRRPVAAALPAGLRPAEPEPDPRPGARRVRWLVFSALIGVATHLAWDAVTHGDGYLVTRLDPLRAEVAGGLTVARLLQYASTALGLAALARYGWRRRTRSRGAVEAPARCPRWGVVALLVSAAALGGAAGLPGDVEAYRHTVEVDYGRPITETFADGTTSTSYPTETVGAPWGSFAEGVLTGLAKRAGAACAVALLLYAAAWHARRALGPPPGPAGVVTAPGTAARRARWPATRRRP